MRMMEADNGNPYSIDPERIATGGSGTGGYLVYGAAFLKRIDQILLLKFFDFADPMNPVPYVRSIFLSILIIVLTSKYDSVWVEL